MERRDLLKGVAALGAASSLTGGSALADGSPEVIPLKGLDSQLAQLQQQPLINQAQAQKVMEEYDLSGMLAANPVNVYYLTNTIPIGVKMRWEYPAFASLPRGADQQPFLITTTAQLWDLVNGDRWVPEMIPYSGPSNWRDYIGEDALPPTVEPTAGRRGYAVRGDSPLGPREKAWADSQKNYQPSPTPEWALARAMRESGITKGRVAVDDMRIAYLLERIGVADDIEFVDGDNLFRRIRYVKSPVEVEYLRIAGRNNHEAAMATIQSIGAGMSFPEVEQRFMTECAARGNDMAFVIAGVTLGLFPDAEVREGQPFLVDAVSSFYQYHGDFARSIVLGEPSKAVQDRTAAQNAARESTYSMLKPGTKYSELRTAGFEAFRKAGQNPEVLIVNPHSLGLQHTDQPYRDDSPWRVGEDLTLEAGMVITVDLPYVEVGFGAGHNEDLVLITEDGYEPLHDEVDTLLIV